MYSTRVEQAVDAFMDRLGGRLGELEVELRYAWRAVDLLSQEYVKMWEKLERLEILLYEQQNVIAQLLSVIKSTGEDPEEYLAARGDSVASDGSLKDRILLKHPDLVSSDLSESDLLGVSGFGAQAEDGSESDPSSVKWGKKYQGFACSSKYMEPSVSSEASEWETVSQGSPGYFHPDLLQYPRREIFTASDYKRYRGGSPCISERDIEELDRLSADLRKVSSASTSTAGARDVYKTLSHIRNSPLRRCMLGAEAEGGLDADTIARIAKLPPYDDFDKISVSGSDRLDLRTSTESLRYTPDSTLSAKENEGLENSSYLNRATTSSWADSSPRGITMMYDTYTTEPKSAPVPPTRSDEASSYASSNYLGHGIEERQKGHALTPVTEISPEYAASDTPGNGTGPSPTSTDKLGSVTDVTVSPLSPLDRSKTIKAEVHSGDKARSLETSSVNESNLEMQLKTQTSESVSPNAQNYNTSPYKEKSRRSKELPQIPYQKTKKSELLSSDASYTAGSSNTFPPPKTPVTRTKSDKESSPQPGRRKLPQPYIDKSGRITYDKSQAVAPAPVNFQSDFAKQYDIQLQDASQTKLQFDSGQLTFDQKQTNIPYETDNRNEFNYDNVNITVDNIPIDQKENLTYEDETLHNEKESYDKQMNEQSYDQPLTSEMNVYDNATYQDVSNINDAMQYSSQYYPEDNTYGNETYSDYQQSQTSTAFNQTEITQETDNYKWDTQNSENWSKPDEISEQYVYNDDRIANISTNPYLEYDTQQQEPYSSNDYAASSNAYEESQYYEGPIDQSYQNYEEDAKNFNSTQYEEAENYMQNDYNYYPQESEDYSNYAYDTSQCADETTSNIYNSEEYYQTENKLTTQSTEEPPDLPPEKPPREHEIKKTISKTDSFDTTPTHKMYSPQKSRNDKKRGQRQYSDPVTSANAILSQTPMATSETITPVTKQLSSSVTSVADDSSTGGGGIFSVLSSKVTKGYKSMISMPSLTKTETSKAAPTTNSTATSNKSGSVSSLFNLGSTLDNFKLGSRTKSRSDSVKSESELSLYDEPQAVIDYQEPAKDRLSETNLLTKDAEDDAEVFYGEPEPQYQTDQQYQNAADASEGAEYAEEEYQDTLEYPEEPMADDYYYNQDTDTYHEEAPQVSSATPSVENERTVTFAEESQEHKEFSLRQERKKSLTNEEAFASLFQTVSKVRHPQGQSKQEDSTESGVLTASVSNESAFFSAAGDSRQSSIAQSEYGSLESTESAVPYDRDVKHDTGSLESYGEKIQPGDVRSPEERGSAEDGASQAEGSVVNEAEVSEEVGTESAPKKGKKVQFESRSPSQNSLEGESEKVKKAVSSTKSKWMKLAVSTIFIHYFSFV